MLGLERQRAKAIKISSEGNFSHYDTRCSGRTLGQSECPFCGGILMDIEKAKAFGAALETVRKTIGRTILTSGVRCPSMNGLLYGKSKSRHLLAFGGDAIDIPLNSRLEVEKCAAILESKHTEIGGIGLHAEEVNSFEGKVKAYWLHIDLRPRMKNGRPLKWSSMKIY